MARNILSEEERLNLADSLGPLVGAGRRGLLAVPEICTLARSSCLLDLIRRHFAAEPFPVRAIYFDKSEATNWTVAWHQDLTIAVRSRIEVSGFGPWSKKDGIPSVQPRHNSLSGCLRCVCTLMLPMSPMARCVLYPDHTGLDVSRRPV
jgi:hypothetical protein